MSTLATLYSLLDSFERGEHNGEAFVEAVPEDVLPMMAECIKTLPEDERRDIKRRLANLIEGIERHKNEMLSDLTRIQDDILAGRKTTKANVAYVQGAILAGSKPSYH